MWLAVALVVAVLPYLPLAVVLYRARWRGLREYGRLAMIYSRRFHARWIEEEPGPDLLGAGDVQSLNDLGGGYGYVRGVRILPIDMRQLIGVAVAVVLPFIPVLLIVVPLPELLAHAAKSVIGHGRLTCWTKGRMFMSTTIARRIQRAEAEMIRVMVEPGPRRGARRTRSSSPRCGRRDLHAARLADEQDDRRRPRRADRRGARSPS